MTTDSLSLIDSFCFTEQPKGVYEVNINEMMGNQHIRDMGFTFIRNGKLHYFLDKLSAFGNIF